MTVNNEQTTNTAVLDEFFQSSTHTPDLSNDPLLPPKPVEEQPQEVQQQSEAPPESVAEVATDVQPVTEDKVELPPEIAAKYSDLDVYLKATVGASLEEVVNTLRDLGSFRQEVVVDREAQALRNEWGVDQSEYSRRMQLVADEFNKLPTKALKDAHDSPEGAKLLWERIEAQQRAAGVSNQPNVPRVVNTQRRGTQNYDFKHSEILRMTPTEYAANSAAITRAFQSGRVQMDIKV